MQTTDTDFIAEQIICRSFRTAAFFVDEKSSIALIFLQNQPLFIR